MTTQTKKKSLLTGIPSHVGMKCNFTITPDEVQKSLTEFLIAECKKACDAITNPNPVSTRTISAIPSCQKFTFEGIEITLGGLSPLSTFLSEKEEFQVSGIHTQKIREEFCCIVA